MRNLTLKVLLDATQNVPLFKRSIPEKFFSKKVEPFWLQSGSGWPRKKLNLSSQVLWINGDSGSGKEALSDALQVRALRDGYRVISVDLGNSCGTQGHEGDLQGRLSAIASSHRERTLIVVKDANNVVQRRFDLLKSFIKALKGSSCRLIFEISAPCLRVLDGRCDGDIVLCKTSDASGFPEPRILHGLREGEGLLRSGENWIPVAFTELECRWCFGA